MFIKANGNLINADHVTKVVMSWSKEDNQGCIIFLSENKEIDRVEFQDKEEYDKYVKYLNNKLSYESNIISELHDISNNIDALGYD